MRFVDIKIGRIIFGVAATIIFSVIGEYFLFVAGMCMMGSLKEYKEWYESHSGSNYYIYLFVIIIYILIVWKIIIGI